MTSPRGHERSEFSAKTKGLALKRCMVDDVPRCEGCTVKIHGTPYFDHKTPAGLGGDNSLENCQVLCRTCHDIKTVTEDRPIMEKADRVFKKHHGLKPPGQKIQSRGFAKRPKQHTATRPINRSGL